MSDSLSGRTAVVTGAAQGLGEAIAVALHARGASVVVADIDIAGAQEVAERLGERARAAPVDVRRRPAMQRLLEEAEEVDIWVNNAARTVLCSFWELEDDEWDDVLATNLRSVFIGCQLAGERMRRRGRGRIINLASLAGQNSDTVVGAHYSASKAGIVALTRIVAAELAPHGVTVNALAPAAIDGPAMQAMPSATIEAFAAQIPVGRIGRAEEVGALAAFLASDDAGYITGATFDVNGGLLMR